MVLADELQKICAFLEQEKLWGTSKSARHLCLSIRIIPLMFSSYKYCSGIFLLHYLYNDLLRDICYVNDLGKKLTFRFLIKPEVPQKSLLSSIWLKHNVLSHALFQNLCTQQTKMKHHPIFSFKSLKERMQGAIDKRCSFHKTHCPFLLCCCSFRCTYVSATYSMKYWWVFWWSSDCHQ